MAVTYGIKYVFVTHILLYCTLVTHIIWRHALSGIASIAVWIVSVSWILIGLSESNSTAKEPFYDNVVEFSVYASIGLLTLGVNRHAEDVLFVSLSAFCLHNGLARMKILYKQT